MDRGCEMIYHAVVFADDVVYVTKELPITEDSKQALIDARISIYYDDSDALSQKMFTGEISLGQWEEQMKKLIRELHTAVLAIVRGGWDKVTFQDWGRLGTPLREQYAYLHKFAGDISANRDTMSLKMIQARARLYGKAAYATMAIFQAGDFAKLLPWLPRDGSTECLMGCTCHWESFIVSRNEEKTVVRFTWIVCEESESCLDCVNRDGHIETIEVGNAAEIPAIIGVKC